MSSVRLCHLICVLHNWHSFLFSQSRLWSLWSNYKISWLWIVVTVCFNTIWFYLGRWGRGRWDGIVRIWIMDRASYVGLVNGRHRIWLSSGSLVFLPSQKPAFLSSTLNWDPGTAALSFVRLLRTTYTEQKSTFFGRCKLRILWHSPMFNHLFKFRLYW